MFWFFWSREFFCVLGVVLGFVEVSVFVLWYLFCEWCVGGFKKRVLVF